MLRTRKHLEHAESNGYPNMAFEYWYQRGLMCHHSRMPTWLCRMVVGNLVGSWLDSNKQLHAWHIGAFYHGRKGYVQPDPAISPQWDLGAFKWPDPHPERAVVICQFEDGPLFVDELNIFNPMELYHQSGERPELPEQCDEAWFRKLGFPVIHIAAPTPEEHLRAQALKTGKTATIYPWPKG